MHFFYSFFRRSLDRYNEDNTKDENKFFILNSINLSQQIIDKKNFKLYNNINKAWKEYLRLNYVNKESINLSMILNHLVTSNQDSIYKALSYLSKFVGTGTDSEFYDRKMSWDTYAVEVN